jgi:hypothetical protein
MRSRVAYRTVRLDGCLLYVLAMRPKPKTLPPRKPWLKADLTFLRLSLRDGMAVVAIAGFLDRDEDEVRQKAEELRRSA